MMIMATLRTLSDKDLLSGMRHVAGTIRSEQVRGLQHLAEIDARKAYLPLGYGSLWAYMRDELKFSESVTSRWTRAMRVTRQYSQALDRLGDGRLTLCAVAMLCEVLNEHTADDILSRAEGKTKMGIQELLVTLAPQPPKKDVTRALNLSGRSEVEASPDEEAGPRPIPRKMPPTVKPQSPEVWRIAFDASRATKDALKRVQELRPGASMDEVIGAALSQLLDKFAPERRQERREKRMATKGTAASPKKTAVAPKSNKRRESVSTVTKDAVSVRDHGGCSYVTVTGKRCESRVYLEYDHVIPVALGGADKHENLRILCYRHHQMVTREVFSPWASSL